MSGILHRLPSSLGLARLWRKIHADSVPVLLLHGILPDADTSPFNSTGKFISPQRLRGFLENVSRIFTIVSFDDYIRSLLDGPGLENVMVVTFDDGYANTYDYGFPLMSEMGLPFAVFVTTGFLDTDRVLWNDLLEFAITTTDERTLPKGLLSRGLPLVTSEDRAAAIGLVKERLKRESLDQASRSTHQICTQLGVGMDSPELNKVRFMTSGQIRNLADRGVVFGGHTVTHPILSRESEERVRREVIECKRTLEQLTGSEILHFAYPNGRRQDFNEMVKQELRRAGYVSSCTSIHGLQWPGDDVFEIKRITVDNRWTYEEFETRTSGILKALRR